MSILQRIAAWFEPAPKLLSIPPLDAWALAGRDETAPYPPEGDALFEREYVVTDDIVALLDKQPAVGTRKAGRNRLAYVSVQPLPGGARVDRYYVKCDPKMESRRRWAAFRRSPHLV